MDLKWAQRAPKWLKWTQMALKKPRMGSNGPKMDLKKAKVALKKPQMGSNAPKMF